MFENKHIPLLSGKQIRKKSMIIRDSGEFSQETKIITFS